MLVVVSALLESPCGQHRLTFVCGCTVGDPVFAQTLDRSLGAVQLDLSLGLAQSRTRSQSEGLDLGWLRLCAVHRRTSQQLAVAVDCAHCGVGAPRHIAFAAHLAWWIASAIAARRISLARLHQRFRECARPPQARCQCAHPHTRWLTQSPMDERRRPSQRSHRPRLPALASPARAMVGVDR